MTKWSRHSRRIDPINLSAKQFCQGEPQAMDELLTDPTASADSIATRENCSVRKINMTISPAFLAPDLVKAAIDGRLPYGMGVARLTDLPAQWFRQHQMLGLPARN
jgi:hypothetical protein